MKIEKNTLAANGCDAESRMARKRLENAEKTGDIHPCNPAIIQKIRGSKTIAID